MPPEIRAMQPNEREAVAQLFHDVWHETQAKLQDARKAAIRGYDFFKGRVDMLEVRTLVAVTEGQIIGFARWTPGHIHSLFVGQSHRGKGVGESLCDAVVAANQVENGCPANCAWCLDSRRRGSGLALGPSDRDRVPVGGCNADAADRFQLFADWRAPHGIGPRGL